MAKSPRKKAPVERAVSSVPPSPSSVPKIVAVVTVAVAIVISFWTREAEFDAFVNTPRFYRTHKVIQDVPVVDAQSKRAKFDDNVNWMTPIIQEVVASRTPVILKNTIVTEWKALQSGGENQWTLENLLTKKVTKQIKNVQYSSNPVFGPLYREDKPLGTISTLVNRNPHDMRHMSAADLYANIMQSEDVRTEYMYYNGDLNSKELVADVKPIDSFILKMANTHPQVNIWLGAANVTASLHYDTYQNFFVQMHGSKRFLLFDPSQSKVLRPFPFLHPSRAQSQRVIDCDNEVSNSSSQLEAWEAVLEPGDVLYVPPVWWHHVTALEPSVSMSIWSVSDEQRVYDDMIKVFKRHVSHHASLAGRLSQGNDIMMQVLQYVLGPKASVNKFIRYNVLESRYGPLIKNGELIVIPNYMCPEPVEKGLNVKTVDELIKLMIKFRKDTRKNWMSNFVETIVMWMVGDPNFVASILSQCY